MRALGSLNVALLKQLPQAQRSIAAARGFPTHSFHLARAFSAVPSQIGTEKHSQQAWTQHLLKVGLGLGAGAGLFAAYGGVTSSQCEQQASAGQTKVPKWSACVSASVQCCIAFVVQVILF